jgi:hypothetical protein
MLAGLDAPEQALEAQVAGDRVSDGKDEEQQVIEDEHVCFQLYEYL